MTSLFSPITLRTLLIPNRLWMSPMCTYSAPFEGALVGAPTDFQLAHAGRKASTNKPWLGGGVLPDSILGWTPVGPGIEPFPALRPPHELTAGEIADIVQDFAHAAKRALQAGFQVVEIHAAHGYLLHSFLSPLTNQRCDGYGGDFAGRTRLVLEVLGAIRGVWPKELPVSIRVSSTDWVAESETGNRQWWPGTCGNPSRCRLPDAVCRPDQVCHRCHSGCGWANR